MLFTALSNAVAHVESRLPDGGMESLVNVLEKPRRMIVAVRDIGPGELVLVPLTTRIGYKTQSDAPSLGEMVAHVDEKKGRYVLESSNTDSFLVEFWVVKRDSEPKNVNMHRFDIKTEGYGVVEDIPGLSAPTAKKNSGERGNKGCAHAYPYDFKIPAFQNRKTIVKGAELVALVDKLPTKAPKPKPVSEDSMLKRKWADDAISYTGKL